MDSVDANTLIHTLNRSHRLTLSQSTTGRAGTGRDERAKSNRMRLARGQAVTVVDLLPILHLAMAHPKKHARGGERGETTKRR